MFALAIDRYQFPFKRAIEAVLVSPLSSRISPWGSGFLILSAQIDEPELCGVVACHVSSVLVVFRSVYVSLKNLDRAMTRGGKPRRYAVARAVHDHDAARAAAGLVSGWLFAAILSSTEFTASLSSPRSGRRPCRRHVQLCA